MRSSSTAACAVLTLFLLSASPACTESAAADWPQWRGPDGNGISPETSWRSSRLDGEPRILWEASVGIGYSSVAVSGDLVYTLGNERNVDTVVCLDSSTGEAIWEYSYRCSMGSYPGPRATPLVDDGVVYTLSREGHLFAFNASNGRVLWRRHVQDDLGVRPPSWGFAGSPVASGDVLVLNAGRSGLALDKRTGDTLWTSGRGPGGYASPVVFEHDGSVVAAIFGRRALYAVDVADGTVKWSYPWVTGSDVNAADPVVRAGRVFLSSGYRHGAAVLDFASGEPMLLWQNDTFAAHFSSFVLIGDAIYGNDGDARSPTTGTFRSVAFGTGREMWSERLGFGSLIAAGDRLIMLTARGELYVARATATRYQELAAGALPRGQYWTPPALSNARLYCRTVRGELYCIDIE